MGAKITVAKYWAELKLPPLFPLLRRKPGRDNAAVARKEGASANPTEAQREERHDNAKTAEDIDETLQKGKSRPDKDGPEIDAFRAKTVQQPAAEFGR